ncbi:hypothetical protein GH714_043841 [Hevea brasiliensis]|uniref:C3H1-type domain-containing protein n=1 Tax=Hevea brasiliensis TaxID=3981 RepID=A0A6A6K0I8_HEVBR|nr:hypothetical protein GH714_043841 [Hevea brasiliensis]
MHQLPHQPVGVQGLQQIPPPPPLPPTFSSFALSGNTLEATVGNPGMSSMVTTPPQPPLPLPSSSPPPIPPSSPPVFSPASVSMPLFAGSNVPCGSNPHSRTLSGYKSGTLGSVAVVKPLNGGQHNIPVHDFSRMMEVYFWNRRKIVQKIEDLCQLIAKNGSSYEDMARLKESGNPEFKFLFGDKIQPAMSTNHLMVTTEPHSPADSDMEMEDDITRSEVDQAMNQPVESASQATDPVSSKFDAKKQLHTLSSSAGSQQPQWFYLKDRVKKAAAAAECIYSDSYSGQVMKGSSPFSLLQDYASNDNSDNDEDPCLKDANPETVSPLVAVGTENLHRDTRLDLKGHTGSKSLYKTERGFGLLPESGMSYKAPDFSSYSQREVKETFPKEDVLGGGGENAAFSGKYEYNKDKNEKSTSNAQKIDSWSPRNQRSGSRSPSSRHAGEFSSGNRRREKGQLAVCFNFRRGRCYRGASCRYMHHDSEKSDGSKRQRSKQQEVQLPPSSMNCNTHEGNKKLSLKVSDHGQEIMNQEGRNNHDTSASSICATKDNTIFHNRKDSVCDALVDSEIIKFDSIRDFVAEVPKTSLVEERSEDASDSNILKSHVEASQDVISSLKDSVIQQSQSVQSDRVLQDADYQAQRTDDSSISDTSPDKTSRTSPKNLHCRETLPNSADSVHNPSQIPTFHFSAPNSDANNAPHMTQLSRDYT